jgi:hypothetical protein
LIIGKVLGIRPTRPHLLRKTIQYVGMFVNKYVFTWEPIPE